jgi:hypothetical protein
MSYQIADFTSQIALWVAKFPGYPTADAELELIASTLAGDAIVHDMTIKTPMAPIEVTPAQTAFTNAINIVVNRGKAGNLTGPQMAAALSGATPPPLQAPVNLTPPVISGSTTIGSVLTCNPGTWSGSPSFEYIWTRNETTIGGATSSTYTIQAIDAGTTLECEVKASNAIGSNEEGSNEIVVPAAAGPLNTVAPVVSGNPVVAWRLGCDTGTWTNNPTNYAYQWMSGGLPIAGAVGANHVLTDDDAGTLVSCEVTATNDNGGSAALSNGMEVVQGPPVNLSPPQASLNPTYVLCTGGTWTGEPPTYAYQWMSNGSPVSGATGATWTFAGYEGTTVLCAVTVSNAFGTCPAVDTNSVVIPAKS